MKMILLALVIAVLAFIVAHFMPQPSVGYMVLR